jgi:hypothetical protein
VRENRIEEGDSLAGGHGQYIVGERPAAGPAASFSNEKGGSE